MNNTTFALNTTESFKTLDKWLELIGSFWILDSLYLFLFTPVSIVGFFLNTLSLIALRDEHFTLSLYEYLRVYCFSGAFLSLVSSFIFCSRSRRFVEFNNSYLAMIYECFVYISIGNTLYFFTGVLDIAIILERLSSFNQKLKWFTTINPKKVYFGILIFCLIINTPYFFVYRPVELDIKLSSNFTYRLNAFDATQFSRSQIGMIITYIEYLFRDILTLLIEITLNIISIIYLKSYMNRKAALTGKSKLKYVLKSDESTNTNNLSENNSTKISNLAENEATKSSSNNQNKDLSRKKESSLKIDQKASLMVISICAMSTIEHILLLACIVYYNYSQDLSAFTLGFLEILQ